MSQKLKKLMNIAFFLIIYCTLFSCKRIICERPLLDDKTSDELNISDAYWLVYSDDSSDPGSAWKVENTGFFNKSKIWVAKNEKYKAYIRAKKIDSKKDTYFAQFTIWWKGKPQSIIGYVVKKSSDEYVIYEISKTGIEMIKNSETLKKLKDKYEIVNKGSLTEVIFSSQAIELYSNEILEFMESLNINIDFEVAGKIVVSDEKTVKKIWND